MSNSSKYTEEQQTEFRTLSEAHSAEVSLVTIVCEMVEQASTLALAVALRKPHDTDTSFRCVYEREKMRKLIEAGEWLLKEQAGHIRQETVIDFEKHRRIMTETFGLDE